MSDPQSLLIRADASAAIGAGHVMRCLALAQAWQDCGGRVVFASAEAPESLRKRLVEEGFETVGSASPAGSAADAAETIGFARQHRARWVVVDGYHFGGDYQLQIKDAGLKLLVLDDTGHCDHYWADAVLNPNPGAAEGAFSSREPCTRLLLGTSYVLLRREFRNFSRRQREVPPVARKVLVTMGGSDPPNATARVLEALAEVGVAGLEVAVVVGGASAHGVSLAEQAAGLPFPVRLHHNPRDLPGLMDWADAAVTAGGTTCWELAYLGVPMLPLALAENQEANVAAILHSPLPLAGEGLGVRAIGRRSRVASSSPHPNPLPEREGTDISPLPLAGEGLGVRAVSALARAIEALLADPALRARRSAACRELVDGQGAARVVRVLREPAVRLRPGRAEDAPLVLGWRNSPVVLQACFSTAPVSIEEHARWFAARLADPACRLWIGLDEQGAAVGQVRIQLARNGVDSETEAEIHVGLAPERIGRGLGTALIRTASEAVFSSGPARAIHAYVRSDNARSARAFESAGYRRAGQCAVKGHHALHYVLRKSEGRP